MSAMISAKLYDKSVFHFVLNSKNVYIIVMQIGCLLTFVYLGFFHFAINTRSIAVHHLLGVWPLWFILIILQAQIRKNFLKHGGFKPVRNPDNEVSESELEDEHSDTKFTIPKRPDDKEESDQNVSGSV